MIRETIIRIAGDQGKDLAKAMGGNCVSHFMDAFAFCIKANASEIQIVKQTGTLLCFNAMRRCYAEMCKVLEAPVFGQVLSCNRDFALIDGFNPTASLIRKRTIMQGDPVCDFRYRLPG